MFKPSPEQFVELWTRFKALPEKLQVVVASEESAERMRAISERNKLTLEQSRALATHIGTVLLGLNNIQNLENDLREILATDPVTARSISGDISREIFLLVSKEINYVQARFRQEQKGALSTTDHGMSSRSTSPPQPNAHQKPDLHHDAPAHSTPPPPSLSPRPAPTLPTAVQPAHSSAPQAAPLPRPVPPQAPSREPPQPAPARPAAPPPPAAPESAQDFDDDWKSKMLAAEPDPFMPHKPKPVPRLSGNVVELKREN